MKPTQLKDIPDLPASAPIYLLHAVVKKFFPPKFGGDGEKKWKIQNATIEQDGHEMQLFITDNDTTLDRGWVGRHISIEAHKGEKGWSGVYAFDDDFKGKNTRKVKVTKTGHIALLESNGASAPTERPAQRQEQRPAQQKAPAEQFDPTAAQEPAPPQRQQRQQEPARTEGGKLHDTFGAGLKVANLQLMCMAIVETYVAPRHREKYNVDLDATHKHAWAMNICIQLEKAGRHNDMPAEKIVPKKKPEPKPDDERDTGEPRDAEGNYLF